MQVTDLNHVVKSVHSKEEILTEALPYIQRYEGKTFVIKYGGAAMTDEQLKESFAKDVTLLSKVGINVVIVHGGGPEITQLSEQLGLETKFFNGQRFTDDATLRVVMMSLIGVLNKEIVSRINRVGGHAVGLSGIDNNLLRAKKHMPYGYDLGHVGEVEEVNTNFLEQLLKDNAVPVIAPLGIGSAGENYNINADLAAAAIASALKAEKLFFLTDTEGILIDGELVPTLTNGRAQEYIGQGLINGGMLPKVSSAFNALDQGVKKVHIVNGGTKHSLLLEIFTHEGIGTQIIHEEEIGQDAVGNPVRKAKPSHFLDFNGLDAKTLEMLFELADDLRTSRVKQPLKGKTVAMIFQKPSLRTRVSFETGIAQLGGTAVVLGNETIGMGTRESVRDISKVLSRYGDCVIARLFGHDVIEELAQHSDVPVVNALTDLLHPCQVMADMYTIRQYGKLKPGMKVTFIGDGNNLANSWLEMAAVFPMHLVISCPKGYEPDSALLQKAIDAKISSIEVIEDPLVAADSADVLYTDVWTSMGQEEESAIRKQVFAPYQINKKLRALAEKDALVMHCLPAHPGEEITQDVFDSHQSIIFDQAENRLHMQKAILAWLLNA